MVHRLLLCMLFHRSFLAPFYDHILQAIKKYIQGMPGNETVTVRSQLVWGASHPAHKVSYPDPPSTLWERDYLLTLLTNSSCERL